MDKQKVIQYWIASAENDWMVAGHLLEKKDYAYALFFGHLTLEKILKALVVSRTGQSPPLTHRLVHLADKTGLNFPDDHVGLLEIVTDFNLEARYPDETFSFQKKCTRDFTLDYLRQIEEMKAWILQKMQSCEM